MCDIVTFLGMGRLGRCMVCIYVFRWWNNLLSVAPPSSLLLLFSFSLSFSNYYYYYHHHYYHYNHHHNYYHFYHHYYFTMRLLWDFLTLVEQNVLLLLFTSFKYWLLSFLVIWFSSCCFTCPDFIVTNTVMTVVLVLWFPILSWSTSPFSFQFIIHNQRVFHQHSFTRGWTI